MFRTFAMGASQKSLSPWDMAMAAPNGRAAVSGTPAAKPEENYAGPLRRIPQALNVSDSNSRPS
jgi:hypothetical protein